MACNRFMTTHDTMLKRYGPDMYDRIDELKDKYVDFGSNIVVRENAANVVLFMSGCYYCDMSENVCKACPSSDHMTCGLPRPGLSKMDRLKKAYIRADRKRFEKLREEILEFIVEFTPEVTKQYIESKKEESS